MGDQGMVRDNTESVIEVEHLHKAYGSTVAVDDVSFSVSDAEVFGLLGPNGAGKTTTVESIVGLRQVGPGTIHVLGRDVSTDGPYLRERVGVQLQESALPPKFKVGEALRLYASFYTNPEDTDALLDTLGIADKRNSYFRDLSGGQRQRLSIALALVGRPVVVLLDELTTGLDPQARRDAWGLVASLRDRGVTVVLVTHDMDEAQHLCDRVALIDAGRVIAIDSPQHLADHTVRGRRVKFRVTTSLDSALLANLPGVDNVTRDGNWVVATGDSDVATTVITALAGAGISTHDVTTESANLEDAFLALTSQSGAEPSTDAPSEDHPAQARPTNRGIREWRRALLGGRKGGLSAPLAAFRQLVRSEFRLATRNPVGFVWGIGFPILLLAIFGSLSSTTAPDASFNGYSFVQIYLPVMLALSLALLALIGVPGPLTSYRELGVLRRMATTPVPPAWLLGAQLVVNLCTFAIAAALVILAASTVFGIHLSVNPGGLVVALVLGAAAMFAIGLCVASTAKTQRAAGAIGNALFFPMAFFAGTWLPLETMPSGLKLVSELTPLGASVHALDYSMLLDRFPPTEPLIALVAWTIGCGWLAIRVFRWE
jgi:ABC-2 type transport system ATP-binding protein